MHSKFDKILTQKASDELSSFDVEPEPKKMDNLVVESDKSKKK